MRFHVGKNGNISVCKAKPGNCPLGGNARHFNSKEEAQRFFDAECKEKFGILGNMKNTDQLNNKLKTFFSKENIEVLDKLNEVGFEAYFVGGSLRDAVINLPVNDVDITTSATPKEILKVFSEYPTIPVGLKHGTVVVLYKGEQVEITTFREDGDYSDNRRPDEVFFSDNLAVDVSRRDFTMNSLAYNHKTGIVDLVGGIDDINKKLIRTVGSPDERFTEDPLRIMRGLRFASKLGFNIEEETEASIFRNKKLLKNVSGERLHKELNGLLMGKNAKEVLLKYSSVISAFIPEIKAMIKFKQKSPYHKYDVWEHSATVVKHAKEDEVHKLAALFHDVGKPETFTVDSKGVGHFYGHAEKSEKIARKVLTRLKYSNAVKSKVSKLILGHSKDVSIKKYKIAKEIYEIGSEQFFDNLAFKRADDMGKNLKYKNRFERLDKAEKIAKEYLADSPILTHKDLAIKPQDIIELGFQGREIGDKLNELALLAISGHKNKRKSQIEYLIKNRGK